MFSPRPLADLPTELHDPTGWAAPGTSVCLHGVPVPSRVLGFSVAWHREPAEPEQVVERDEDETVAPTPLRLVKDRSHPRSDGPRSTAAA